MALDEVQRRLLKEIAGLESLPKGAYNIRANGTAVARETTANIDIVPKQGDEPGIEIHVKPGTKQESVHIPVVLSESGLKETVYNDFYIGEDCDVVVVAGCGIDNCGGRDSQHDGVHRFWIGRNSHVRYVENHYGSGTGAGKRILNPVTELTLAEGATVELEMVQIKGVSSTNRTTKATLAGDAHMVVRERLMTAGEQTACSIYHVVLDGEGSSADVVSRGVARDRSYQKLDLGIEGNAACSGHTECDSIIMDEAKILAVPSLAANCVDAQLVHEAAIGKIAGDQLIKLMTLGLTEKEAEEQMISGFLK